MSAAIARSNDARAADRLRLLIVLVLCVAMALGSLWVREVLRAAGSATVEAAHTEPDYFVDNFNFVRASKIGQARYSVSGTRLTHFPRDDNYAIELPVIKSLSVDRPSIIMRAQTALSNSDASQVQMIGDVHIDRPASKAAPDFHLSSDAVTILPDDDIMQTDKAVVITQGLATIAGVGMLANNATLNFTLYHHVQTVVQAHKH